MAALDKEIKKVLLGRTKLLEDGRLSTLGEGDFMMPRGVVDGAASVRFLGVMRKAKILKSDLPEWKIRETVAKAMQNIGRGLVLQEEPEAIACLLRYVLSRPAVLCFSWQDGLPVIGAYTGRGLTGFISLIRALNAFKKELPESVQFSDDKAPDHRREEKALKKLEKAEKKQARKAARIRKKGKLDEYAEPRGSVGEAAEPEGTAFEDMPETENGDGTKEI